MEKKSKLKKKRLTTNGDILCNDQKNLGRQRNIKGEKWIKKTWFKEKNLKLKTKLVIYRNLLSNKNIKDHDLIGIILELIYSNTIAIDAFLEISKRIIEYKNKNIRYLDELENIYETLTGDTKKKEAFRKNLLDWVKKYVEYLKNEKKKVIQCLRKVKLFFEINRIQEEKEKMITVSLILKIISLFIAGLCLILIEIDKERHILNTKMKTIIAILGILAFIYSLYILWKLIILMERGKIITISLILKIISFFIAVLYLILIGTDKERHILSTKMKTTINILGILAFIYFLYILWKIITLIRE